MTVPPAVVATNRAQLSNLLAGNVFRQNAAAIAATDAQYADMWAEDAAALNGYASAASAGHPAEAHDRGNATGAAITRMAATTRLGTGCITGSAMWIRTVSLSTTTPPGAPLSIPGPGHRSPTRRR